jgi:hypothetical protein
MLHDARPKLDSFAAWRLRDGIQCREEEGQVPTQQQRQLPGAQCRGQPVDGESSATGRTSEAPDMPDQLQYRRVDAKIMVTSLDTQLRMVSSDGTKILSLHLVKAHCRVYDSDEDEHAAFHMTREHDGSVRHFRPSVSGLYYYYAENRDNVGQ